MFSLCRVRMAMRPGIFFAGARSFRLGMEITAAQLGGLSLACVGERPNPCH
jgi:hypothetical protein